MSGIYYILYFSTDIQFLYLVIYIFCSFICYLLSRVWREKHLQCIWRVSPSRLNWPTFRTHADHIYDDLTEKNNASMRWHKTSGRMMMLIPSLIVTKTVRQQQATPWNHSWLWERVPAVSCAPFPDGFPGFGIIRIMSLLPCVCDANHAFFSCCDGDGWLYGGCGGWVCWVVFGPGKST